MVKTILEKYFKKWIFRGGNSFTMFTKYKTQYVQNAPTARYHQLHGKISRSFERYFDKDYN